MAFAKVGLTGDSGVSWTLPRLAGPAVAAELLLLAEPVNATRALELGLVNEVVPIGELAGRVARLAGQLAAGPTVAYAAIKEALAYGAGHSLAETLEREAELQARCGQTADHEAATFAFLAKQPVSFLGR
jgi:2-(1,2-epoxy-1,2-dihydrophenyl)acetyl-CoA isomerase